MRRNNYACSIVVTFSYTPEGVGNDQWAYLQLDVGLFTDGYLAANVGVLLVLGEELVATREDVPQPPQDLAIVADLPLDQLLAYVV